MNDALLSASQWIGKPLRRLEDGRLLTGAGRFTDDLGVKEDALRIVSADVGGGFGARGYAYPEHAALLWAARKLGRPLRWLADRSENFLCEVHGRDNLTVAELALDAGHGFTALRIRTLANVGAYVSSFGAAVPAIVNAVIDALGVKEIDMPLTAEKVWRALRKAGS